MSDHPLSLGGSSAIDLGPWHYGADYLTVYFDAEPSALAPLIPSPFKVGGGGCMAYVCEIISVSDRGGAAVSAEPARTQYYEAAVGIGCSHEGKTGIYFPVMWVTTEWALLRGLVNGYQKRLADSIVMTKLHPLNPGLSPIGEGSSLAGYCVKGGERALSLKVVVERKSDSGSLRGFGATFGMRLFPRTDASQGSVAEAVEVMKANSRSSDVWTGSGAFSTSLELGKARVTGAAVYRSGFTIMGSRVLARL